MHTPVSCHEPGLTPNPPALSQILDELIIAGEMQESSKKSVLRVVSQSDGMEEAENSEDVSPRCRIDP